MDSLKSSFTLLNGVKIPCVGYGTWQTPVGKVCSDSVACALETGYRHIDTAAAYENEKSVGEGIRQSQIDRKDIFVTSKLWNSERGYEKTKNAFYKTLDNLMLDYLDLYLIHWPAPKCQFDDWDEINLSTWSAMCELYNEGLIKSIGVSNFLPHHLESLIKTDIIPMVNQIEYHPGQIQAETVDYCNEHGIIVEAWSPLARGTVFTNNTLIGIAEKYQRSVTQICLKWCLQNNILPLTKTVTPDRIKENSLLFDFTIADEDMKKINALPYFGGSGHNPDTVKF